jgi:hypothetical protein
LSNTRRTPQAVDPAAQAPGRAAPDAGLQVALQRWVGEGGRDRRPRRPRRGRRARSIEQIDANATQEASDTQSSADAEDRAAKSPADEGGQG